MEGEMGEMNPVVFDPSVVPYPIQFIDPAVQSRYFGTVNRLRRKFLDEHKGLWRPYKTIGDGVAVLRPRIEGGDIETIPGTPSSSRLLSDTRLNTNGTEVSLPTPTKALLPAHEPALVTLPAVIGPQAVSTRDEIIIDGRRLISDRRVAAMLKVSKRTLQRWQKANKGPPRVKIGGRIFYDEDKLKAWIQDQ
jgi:predicted DNA-binding transcriptional regulator AlpA